MILSSQQLELFRQSVELLADKAANELDDAIRYLWIEQGKGNPAILRKIIGTVAQPIANKYGVQASTLSAEMWESIYKSDTGRSMDAILADIDAEKMFGTDVGYALRNGSDTDVEEARNYLDQIMSKAIRMYSRETTRKNNKRARSRGTSTKYMRVPRSDCKCAFCIMLAGRGPVYETEESAGDSELGDIYLYHNDCHCTAIPAFGDADAGVEDYDFTDYTQQYKDAAISAGYENVHSRVGKEATSNILSSMRANYGYH